MVPLLLAFLMFLYQIRLKPLHLFFFSCYCMCFISCLLLLCCKLGYDASCHMDDFYDLNNWRKIEKRLMDHRRSEIMICRMDLHQPMWPWNDTVVELYNERNWQTKLPLWGSSSLSPLCGIKFRRFFYLGTKVVLTKLKRQKKTFY